MGNKMQGQLQYASRILTWNRWALSVMGLWPLKRNDFIFVPAYAYLTLHCIMTIAELLRFTDAIDFTGDMLEVIICTMSYVKLGIYRVDSSSLMSIVEDVNTDFDGDNYHTSEELNRFLRYNVMSKLFMKIAFPTCSITTILYFLIPLTGQDSGPQYCTVTTFTFFKHFLILDNSTKSYVLPYRTRLTFDITEKKTYLAVYLYQSIAIPILITGVIGIDCSLVTLTLHVCGQYSALCQRIKEVINDSDKVEFNEIIMKHQRLIRLTRKLNSFFSIILLYQMLCMTLLLCLTGYNVIASLRYGQSSQMLTFAVFLTATLQVLFGYCFIGECLITETSAIFEALYSCNWYFLNRKQLRLFQICLVRAQLPLTLTGGNFFVFSLANFSETVKTSVAYLSVLRELL